MTNRSNKLTFRNVCHAALFVLKRCGLLYLVFALCGHVLINNDVVKGKTLNSIRPSSFNYLFDVTEHPEKIDRKQLWEYVYYYKKLVDFLPNLADAYGMLGFCYYHLGKTNKAIDNYKKAVLLAPQFFWFRYNLGVIYYRKQDYVKAAKCFKAAIALDLEESIVFISMSKMYKPMLWSGAVNTREKLMSRMREGYLNVCFLLVLSSNALKQYDDVYRYAKKAIKEDLGAQASFYYYAGVGAFYVGGFDRAVKLLRKSIKLSPNYADAYYYLGLSLKKSGYDSLSKRLLTKAFGLRKEKITLDMITSEDIHLGIF